MKKINFIFAIAFVLLLANLANVYAAGVAAEYWDTAGEERPMIINPGDRIITHYTLLNDGGDQPQTFTIAQNSGKDIARILNPATSYTVNPDVRNTTVDIEVFVPSDAVIGSVTKLSFRFDITPLNSTGQFFKFAQIRSFDVIVREKIKAPAPLQPVSGEEEGKSPILLIVLIILIVIVLVIIFARSNKNKGKRR